MQSNNVLKTLTLFFLRKQSMSENKEIKFIDYVYPSKTVNNTNFAIKSFDKKL